MIAGVCGGVAEYFDLDPTLVRIIALVLVVVGVGFPIILYIIGMVLMPPDPGVKQGYVDAQAEPEPAPCQAPFVYQPKQPASEPQSAEGNATNPSASVPFNATATATSGTASNSYWQTNGSAQPPPPNSAAKVADAVAGTVKKHWSSTIALGALLIGVGILALLANFINLSIWNFWPIILIIVGLIQLFTPSSKGWSLERAGSAIAFISIGLALLAWMLRVITVNAFVQCFFNLWPVLLVVAGLAIIGNSRKVSAFNLVGSLLFSATLILGLWAYGGISSAVVLETPDGGGITLDVPYSPTSPLYPSNNLPVLSRLDLAGATDADFYFEGGGASATVAASTGNELLLKGSILASDRVEFYFDGANKTAAHLKMHKLFSGSQIMVDLPSSARWNEMSFEAGASNLQLNLRGLDVKGLTVNTGVSACDIDLDHPVAAGSSLKIASGMASIKLQVPTNCAVIVHSSGLNAVNCPDGSFSFNEQLMAWCSEEYIRQLAEGSNEAGRVWDVELSGMASLEISVSN